MLDIKRISENPQELETMLKKRRFKGANVENLLKAIEKTRSIKTRLDEARSIRNSSSKEIGNLIAQGKKEEAEKRKAAVKTLGDDISKLEKEYESFEELMREYVIELPNFLESDVPDGPDDSANVFVREHGKKPAFDFKPLPHYDLGEKLNILDFERGVKLSGSRFYVYRGLAARLERAIINFMLDLHTTKFGYTEMWVPQIVNDESMTATGQYPKFKGDFYRLDQDGLSLIPTAEVPLTNLYRDEIISEETLPIAITAATSCFRREAGAAGKDTRGIVRVHQFQKVELVQFVHPDKSREVHEQMVAHAEEVLKQLNLHYRVMLLSSGDIGASSAKTYDLEVWMPGLDRYLEISSISNFLDFQSRRGMIRFKGKDPKAKTQLVHTLNGSGLAAGRTMIAVMENCQKKDGTFEIPEVLKSYMKS